MLVVPEYEESYGDQVNDFMARIGLPMDPWQAEFNRLAFAVDAGGQWAAFELMVFLARQNGKGVCAEALKLAKLFLFKEELVIYSAHQLKTTMKAFKRLKKIIKKSDWLSRRVLRFHGGPLVIGVELTPEAGGGMLEYVARSTGSGRGYTGSTSIFDEALALTIAQYQAITPALSTLPNPQLVFLSSPPDEDSGPMPQDAMLPSVRRRAHAGEARMAIMEWSPPEGYDIEDRQVWADCNPSMNLVRPDGSTGVSEWFLAKQLSAFTEAGKPEKFATEHLGEWPPEEAAAWQVISQSEWEDGRDPASELVGRPAFAIALSMDRQWTVIGAAGRREDGLRHVEVIDSREGTGWVVERLRELKRKWRPWAVTVRPTGPAASLLTDLEAARFDVVRVNIPEGCQACGMFFDAFSGPLPQPDPDDPEAALPASPRNVRHRGQTLLDTSVARAARRKVNNVWEWDLQTPSVDCSPLQAVTDALWAFNRFARSGMPAAGKPPEKTGGDFYRSGGQGYRSKAGSGFYGR